VFVSEYSSNKPGRLLIGSRSIVAIFSPIHAPNEWSHRIDFEWDFIETIYTQDGRSPSLRISCNYAPRMYRRIEVEQILPRFGALTQRNQKKKARISCLDQEHSKVAGSCLTYEFIFKEHQSFNTIRNLVENIHDGPTSVRIRVKSVMATTSFNVELAELNFWLSRYQIPFAIKFQVMKLVLNGHLPPKDVRSLIPIVKIALKNGRGVFHCGEALRQLDRDLPWPSPQTHYDELAPPALEALLQKLITSNLENCSTYRAIKRNDTLALIHHVRITPAGIYLEGPEPEVSNTKLPLRPNNSYSTIGHKPCAPYV
jgi:hypothetical protein